MSLAETTSQPRTRENAPEAVRERGGVALSLWLTGANETDVLIVAGLSIRCQKLTDALLDIEDTPGSEPSGTGRDRVHKINGHAKCVDIARTALEG